MPSLAELSARFKKRGAAAILVAVLSGSAIGVLLVPRAPAPSDAPSVVPAIEFLGRPLALDEKAGENALNRARSFVQRPFTLKFPDGRIKNFSLGRLGAQIDKVRVAELVRDAADATSPMRRVWSTRESTGPLVLPVPVEFEVDSALAELLKLKDHFDRTPVDARLNLEKKQLVKEVEGRELDVDATLFAMQGALEKGKTMSEVRFVERRPRRVAAELGNVKFNHVLAAFDTPYNRSDRARARTFNLRLAASKLDGYVLMPGEIFDFNDVVGPRDEANGYQVAPVIAEGELVDGIGGGTCQVSGTLHGAAFFAGLEIVERYPHTRPSHYIKMGLDATVVYPTINFRVRNNYEFPIVLHEIVKNGRVRAEVLGPERPRTVTLIRRITGVIPYAELERPDKSVPDGMRVLGQRGVPGFKVRRYRITREGSNAVRERWDDIYPPTAQIVRVGTGEIARDRFKGKSDETPEYVADEVLIMTNLKEPTGEDAESEMVERREPGRFGKYGWTQEEGMPIWKGTS